MCDTLPVTEAQKSAKRATKVAQADHQVQPRVLRALLARFEERIRSAESDKSVNLMKASVAFVIDLVIFYFD